MDPLDSQIAALESEIAQIQAELATPVAETPTEPSGYNWKQGLFDVGSGAAKAAYGLADVLTAPVVAGANLFGAELPYFGMSKMGEQDINSLAKALNVSPNTAVQEAVSFLTPSPISKAKLAGQVGTGLAAYLGFKGAERILPDSSYAGLVGALAAPAAVSGAAKAASSIAPSLEDVGMGLQRKARGARVSDYKLAKNAIIETVEGDTTTQLKKSFDNLIEKGTFGKNIDPESMYPKLQAAKEATEDSIQSVLKGTETKVGPVPPPSFDKTLEYVSKNIAANDVDKYLNEVISLQDALRREGKGSLVYLNQQKKIIGENWKNSSQSDPGFWRTLYRDMKGHIEKYAPEVKDLNKQKQDLIVVSPIIERGFKASGADYDIGKIQQLLNTTGGAGLAGGAILGAAAGDVGAGVLGALTLRALSTPKGQNLAGKLATNLSKVLPKQIAPTSLQDLVALAGKAAPSELKTTTELSQSTDMNIDARIEALTKEIETLQAEQTPVPETLKVGKQNISIPQGEQYAPPNLVKAVMKVESAGEQKAVSSKGATGLMQLMPATAKALGVDPKDPQENVEGGSRYLQQMISKYGKKDIALAAYNWGPGNIDKAIRQVKADGKRVTWANIMQAVKVPMETRLYVNKVLEQLA